MPFKITGLDEVKARLQKLADDAKALDGSMVPINEIFSDEFMQACSKFSSFEEFLTAGGFQARSAEEFESIPLETLSAHTKATTHYNDWPEMKDSAVGEYAKQKLGL